MNDETADYWQLYRVASICTMAIALLTPLAIVVFIIWRPPYKGTIEDWFQVFQDSRFVGLLSMDLLLILVLLLEIPVILGLYAALRPINAWLITLAVISGWWDSVSIYPQLLRLRCSHSANSILIRQLQKPRKSSSWGAGEAMLATYEGTRFHLNYILGGTIVPALISLVMLSSNALD